MPIIEANHLTKVYKIPEKDPGVAGAMKALFRPRFKTKPAVTDVSFAVEPGEIVGYIGVNGAGKSTTIKMLTGSGFWLMDSVPVTRVVFEMHEFAKYPLTIYPRAIGILLTVLIPYGFASFYPASYVLGREVAPALTWGAPLVAAVLMVVALGVWRFGLRHYSSTGT